MDTQTLDRVVVDAAMDKVEVVLGLADRAAQELKEALLLEPGSEGLEHIEGLLYRVASGLRSELRIAGRSGYGVPAESGIKSHLFTCGECGYTDPDFEGLQAHVYGEHLGAAV